MCFVLILYGRRIGKIATANYLKDKQHYVDFFDLLTVKECLRVIKTFQDLYKESLTNEEIEGVDGKEKVKAINYLLYWRLYTIKAERYQGKGETIERWVAEDRLKQEKLDDTSEPLDIICSNCCIPIHSNHKYLEDYLDKPLRVLFFFECSSCKKRKGVYDNGEEHLSKPQLCPNCHKEVKVTRQYSGEIITWITACPTCGFEEKEVDDFKKKEAEWQEKEKKDKELLEKHRDEFCLSEKEGKEHIEMIEKLQMAHVIFEEAKKKHDDPAYDRVLQLKKINVTELEELLTERLEKERYIKLSFDKPEIGQHVIVPFTLQDSDSSRGDSGNTRYLQDLIKVILEMTNWQLLNNSLSYRLGYISGQLKGYEREEEMLEMAGRKKEKKLPKEDQERRMKYSCDPIVQFAQMAGDQEGIENVRKRRLGKEPEGFFLEDAKDLYTCGICGQLTPGNLIWWNLDGLRCADCWRNIKQNVIPPLKYRYDDGCNWFQDWQIKSDYGVHPATARKLRREGLLKGRDLKRKDGSTYCTVYLISENQEFLRKYTKKPAMKIEFINSGDKKYNYENTNS